MDVLLDGSSLTPTGVVAVARHSSRVGLKAEAQARLARPRAAVEALIGEGRVVYGLTTGVGDLRTTRIPPDQARALQRNLLRSHAVGVGPALPEEIVRAAILVRANQFCRGVSGVRPAVAEALIALLNQRIYPWVPETGSLGASGDLAQSAHLGLVLIGEGQVLQGDRAVAAAPVLSAVGLPALELEAKEALALLNGTHFMTGVSALLLADADRLLPSADVAAALSVEALRASRTAFDPRIHAARPHPGQIASAARIWALTEGSGIVESHALCDRVQDAYSVRCAPQVHGASADAIAYLRRVVEVELNAGIDNPMVFPEEPAVLSGGNFHGEPLALALDLAAIALAELGSISERRLFRLLSAHLSDLPAFLTRHSGLNSGYMLLQYTAAALVTENQLLASPASIHSLPTSADQEDHVSMGWHSALKARKVARNVDVILALEALAAAQGLDLLAPLTPGPGTHAAYLAIRERVPVLDQDRILHPEIEAATTIVREGGLARLAPSPRI